MPISMGPTEMYHQDALTNGATSSIVRHSVIICIPPRPVQPLYMGAYGVEANQVVGEVEAGGMTI
jgi:hypothetical protein